MSTVAKRSPISATAELLLPNSYRLDGRPLEGDGLTRLPAAAAAAAGGAQVLRVDSGE